MFDLLIIKKALSYKLSKVFLIFLSLLVAANIVFAMSLIYFDIQSKISAEFRNFGANLEIFSQKEPLDKNKLEELKNLAPKNSIKAQSPYLYAVLRTDLEKIGVLAMDLSQQKYLNPYWQIQGLDIGVDFDYKNALIGTNLAQRLNLKLGDSLKLYLEKEIKTLKIKGIIESGERVDNFLIVNYEFLQKMLPNNFPQNAFFNLNTQNLQEFSQTLQQKYPNLEVRIIRKISEAEGEILGKIKRLISLITLLILLLSTLSTNTTIFAIVSERSQEFALKKALGASDFLIFKQIIAEILLIFSLAFIFSLVSGYFLAQLLAKTVFSADTIIKLNGSAIILSLFLTITTTFLAILIPLKRIFKINTAVSLKGE